MTTDRDHILSDFMDAWNRGARPDVDDYLERAAPEQRDDLAGDLATFLRTAPTPDYDDATLQQLRDDPVVVGALGEVSDRAGLLPALLRRVRERLGLSTDELAASVVTDLQLADEHRTKTATYLSRLESGELATSRISEKVFGALARALGVPSAELTGAADMVGPPRTAPAFRAASAPAAAGAAMEMMADALQTPAPAKHDEVDELFLGGR